MNYDACGRENTQSLARDYERIATLRLKRTVDLAAGDAGARAALDRLIASGLALELHGAIVLMRPDDSQIRPDDAHFGRMHENYLSWLRADRFPASGELLFGEPGFWQHSWNRIRDRDYVSAGPLVVDIVVPDDGTFPARAWIAEFDPHIRAHVLDGGLIQGRVILPPDAIRSAVEPMLDLIAESGLEVRILSTEARFVLYDSATALLNEPLTNGGDTTSHAPEPYWAVRSDEVTAPLKQFFDLLWESATPYWAHRDEADETLALLGRGSTDAQIAVALNVSPRTVSRRVAALMDDFGASSRFELGMRYERARPKRERPGYGTA